MANATQLVRYDAMSREIAAAHEVDAVKDIRNKAIALEHYARPARNTLTLGEGSVCWVSIKISPRIRFGPPPVSAPWLIIEGVIPQPNGPSRALIFYGISGLLH